MPPVLSAAPPSAPVSSGGDDRRGVEPTAGSAGERRGPKRLEGFPEGLVEEVEVDTQRPDSLIEPTPGFSSADFCRLKSAFCFVFFSGGGGKGGGGCFPEERMRCLFATS